MHFDPLDTTPLTPRYVPNKDDWDRVCKQRIITASVAISVLADLLEDAGDAGAPLHTLNNNLHLITAKYYASLPD